MTRKLIAGGAALLLLAGSGAALARASVFGAYDAKHPVFFSSWPAGVKPLVNRPERVSGHGVNANARFQYAGKAGDLNRFLNDYARDGEGSHRLTILGKGADLGVDASAAWELDVFGYEPAHSTVILPLKDGIRLRDLRVPAEVAVEYAGEQNPEFDRFRSDLENQRKKAPKSDAP